MANDNQRKPDKQPPPREYAPGRLTPAEVALVDKLAEEDFARRWGWRPVYIHLIKRDKDSLPDRIVVQPEMLKYMQEWPGNIAVAYEVDLLILEATPLGWKHHRDLRIAPDLVIYDLSSQLEPMGTFCTPWLRAVCRS